MNTRTDARSAADQGSPSRTRRPQTAPRAIRRHRRRSRLLPESPGNLGLAWRAAICGLLHAYGSRAKHLATCSLRITWHFYDTVEPATFVISFGSMFCSLVVFGCGVWAADARGELLAAKRSAACRDRRSSGQQLLRASLVERLNFDASCSGFSHDPRSTGNICCWVLYFFECSIFGSRFPRGRRNRCRAVGVSWRTIGSREFTPQWSCGSRERGSIVTGSREQIRLDTGCRSR